MSSRPKVNHEEFVRLWMSNYQKEDCCDIIARKLGVEEQYVRTKSVGLRAKGVKLPKIKMPSKFSADELNRIIESLKE